MSKINNVRLPNAAQIAYSPNQIDQLIRSVEQIVLQLNSNYTPSVTENNANALSFMEGSGSNSMAFLYGASLPYGSFYDTTSQTAAAINTAYPITYNSTTYSNGVYIDPAITSRVYVDQPGIYNFQFSVQLDKNNASSDHVFIWARLNGVDLVHSAGKVSLTGSDAEVITSWNYLVDMNSGDYFQLMWSGSSTSIIMTAFPAVAPVPAIPSVILTASYVSSSHGSI